MNASIVIVGEGRLASLVHQAVSGSYRVIRRKTVPDRFPRTAKLCVVLNEDYRPAVQSAVEEALHSAGIPWLGATVVREEGIVGPLVRSDKPGCARCAFARLETAGRDRDVSAELQMELFLHDVVLPGPSVSRWSLGYMSGLIAAEAKRAMRGDPCLTEGCVYLADLKTLSNSLHAYLPDPQCPLCGEMPDDREEDARIALQPSPKANAASYRTRAVAEMAEAIHRDYRDERTGLMNAMSLQPGTPFCDALARLPTSYGNEITAGRAHAYPDSALTALFEGLERYCGAIPRRRKTRVRDAYRNLADRALDPRAVGLYSPEQYASPDFPYEPFDPDAPIPWVWGYSLIQERPLLIPEQLVYYSSGFGGGFVAEGSNGSAIGGSLAEAILYGLFEAVERDAFLLAWYARLSVPRLDPYASGDDELTLMLHRLEAVAGYEVQLFNTTLDTGIPSIWALGKNRKPGGANLICAAGAHLDPVRAAKSAIMELAGHAGYLDGMSEDNRREYVEMLRDPDRVSEMPDHALLYTVPEAESRLDFLLRPNRPAIPFWEAFEPPARRSDLTEELKALLRRFRDLRLDVIVVNQTADEIRRNGLHCVKVIVPGLLPMTFGHHLRRLTGLERLFAVPAALGYAESRLTPTDLNPHPHPFL
ncbi:TOMM precursor leader peptide-binding protein [Cohnella nanjingensis]|uniref:TOMM leader peptide-binding protein n=1 Tax=Cohnella nanjingensis TaxID=1387779 RepID=A0A7X0RW20_9BACL|nr:TOMM precursor leader peptide-binding protein [Cohnella nanjingensis]MBB6674661.1 TOMM precursor leader peptide-binding protein [Cohnella nanjingensis]